MDVVRVLPGGEHSEDVHSVTKSIAQNRMVAREHEAPAVPASEAIEPRQRRHGGEQRIQAESAAVENKMEDIVPAHIAEAALEAQLAQPATNTRPSNGRGGRPGGGENGAPRGAPPELGEQILEMVQERSCLPNLCR